ncbi:MAG TPA: winged helix-turn-helix domain-containing protein [Candidatus Acidoferrales bacterium]|nr:winged helix-turn-helix domain-containing protein [Candidatus Acidoferrales bacterium]
MSFESQPFYEFGPFRLKPSERLLLRADQAIPLPPKAFDTLLLLVQNSGHVLSKDELMKSLWPNTFVEENNLTQNISQLRRALGEASGSHEFIETVPRLGYRFVMPVEEVDGNGAEEVLLRLRTRTHIVLHEQVEEEASNADSSEPRAPKTGRSKSWTPSAAPAGPSATRRFALGSALGAACVVALLTTLVSHWASPKPATPTRSPGEPRAVAVLPLRNLKPDPETDFLSLALTDAIINRLGYASQLSVQPASSVVKYRNTEMDPLQVARELNVQTVLTGSYVKEGDSIRIMTELISTDGSRSPSRENIELKYEKLLSVQDRVAESVIHSMGFTFLPQEVEQLRRGLPTNPVAYEYYLRGNDLALKSNYKGAADLLEKSVTLEPGNAMAWAGLGNNNLGYARLQGGGRDREGKGWRAFQKAEALDPGNPAIASLMALQLMEGGKVDEAVPLLRQALQRNPNASLAHWYLSEAYRYGGMLEESIREGELARQVNPGVEPGTFQNAYLYLSQYQEFLRSLPAAESARTSFYRGLANCYLKDTSRATAEFDHAFALNPTLLHAQIGKALAFGISGERAKGIALVRRIEASENHDGEMVYKMSQAYAQLGDKKSSLRLLRRSIDLNFFPYSYFVQDPLLEPIRTEPGYAAVMELGRQRQQTFRQRFF